MKLLLGLKKHTQILYKKNNRRFYHVGNIIEKSETPLMVGALLGAGGYLATGEDEAFWKAAAFGTGAITVGKKCR